LIEDEHLRRDLGGRGLDYVTQYYAKERLLADVSELYAQFVDPVSVKAPSPSAKEMPDPRIVPH